VIVFGPVFLFALVACTIVSPLCVFVVWIFSGDERMSIRETLREMWIEAAQLVWRGV
jgi:hypothetical protein